MQFIGGFSAKSAVAKAMQLYKQHGILPILDYAREGDPKHSETVKLYMTELKNELDSHTNIMLLPNYAVAYKLSAFSSPQDIYESIKLNGFKTVMLDAESPEHYVAEQSAYKFLVDQVYSSNLPPLIYKTIQMYRRDSLDAIESILKNQTATSTPVQAIKLVRGAYLDTKRPDIFYTSKSDTDSAYNRAVSLLLNHYTGAICIATHNKTSIDLALQQIQTQNHKISFAQLLGMADHISYSLIARNQIVYKYMPYGRPHDLIPYLSRRLIENYPILQHAKI